MCRLFFVLLQVSTALVLGTLSGYAGRGTLA